jgi:hypothetical protein
MEVSEDSIALAALEAIARRSYYTFDNFMYCGIVEGFKRELMLSIRNPVGFLAWENVGITIETMYGVLE